MKNHVIAGVSGDDLDIPGYLQAHDPMTGEMQWRWYAVPQKRATPVPRPGRTKKPAGTAAA